MPDHLGITSTKCKVALITGDPGRLPSIAGKFDISSQLTDLRGFICFEATFDDKTILIVSTGIGSPSTAIVVEELIELGICCIIRLGTCGALQQFIKPSDLILPIACIRDEGTTQAYIDKAFPAVSGQQVLSALISSAKKLKLLPHIGVTHCKDSYYSERFEKLLDPEEQGRRWSIWKSAGVLATEMEISPLFVIGRIRKIQTGAVLIAVGKGEMPDFQDVLENAIELIKNTINSIYDELDTSKCKELISRKSFLEK